MSSMHTLVDGKQKDVLLHSPIIGGARIEGSPVQDFVVKRYMSLGMTEAEAKELLRKPYER